MPSYNNTQPVNFSAYQPVTNIAVPPTPTAAPPPPTVPRTLSTANLTSTGATSNLPQAPTDTNNYAGIIANGNAILKSIQDMRDAQAQQQQTAAPDTSLSDLLTKYLSSSTPPPSATDTYNSLYASSGIDQKQADLNTAQKAVTDAQAEYDAINAQLQGVNAEAQAIPIRDQQNAEGRGITAAGLAPITAGELRMNALKAIPLQAQAIAAQAKVAAAQGNATLAANLLNSAQSHLEKVFQLQQQDAQNQYNYRLSLAQKIYEFGTAQEKQRADELKATLTSNQTQRTDAVNFAQQLALKAMESGQSSIAAKISQIAPPDINSKTFASDLQNYNSRVSALEAQFVPKPTVTSTRTTSSGTKTPTTSAKGQMSNKQFVEISLEKAGLAYQAALNSVPKGKLGVIDNATGQIGYIDPTEYNTRLYTEL